eukprot:340185_1
MGSCSSKLKSNLDLLLCQKEKQFLAKHEHDLSDIKLKCLLLIHGYFRKINVEHNDQMCLPLDLAFCCFKLFVVRIKNQSTFTIRDMYTNGDNRNKIGFTLFERGNLSDFSSHKIICKDSIKPLKSSHSCYVPNISNISAEINLNLPAIINCGQLQDDEGEKLSLLRLRDDDDGGTDKDYCSAIIFNQSSNSNY